MNQANIDGIRWNVGKVERTYEQRLRLKKDERPCPKIVLKNRSSDSMYKTYSWICGDEAANTYFCWQCLIMGDLSKVSVTFKK